jgi:uncharacterized protein YndB with AHSA1/START domain
MAHDLTITRNIDATPDEIFDAWTDPASMKQWFRPGPINRVDVVTEPKVGGKFRIDMFEGQKSYPHHGEYLRLERPRLLEFTWISNSTQQQRSVVTIELHPNGKGTDLKLTHTLLPNEKEVTSHREGWTDIVEKLAGALAVTR